jgi:hypothetical protein
MEGAGDNRSKWPLPDIALSASLFINLLLMRNIELKIRALGGSAQSQVREMGAKRLQSRAGILSV